MREREKDREWNNTATVHVRTCKSMAQQGAMVTDLLDGTTIHE